MYEHLAQLAEALQSDYDFGDEFAKTIRDKYGIEFWLRGPKWGDEYEPPIVSLDSIKSEGDGKGSQAMQELVEWADENGYILTLHPTSDFGGSVPRLKKFYKRFGFVSNSGRNKDFRSRDAMIRYPKKQRLGESWKDQEFEVTGRRVHSRSTLSESDTFLDDVFGRIERAADRGFEGFGGKCGEAAVSINRELFGGKGKLVAAVNKYLWETQDRLVGHVAVYWPLSDTYWDSEGEKEWEDIESWGMLDPEDPDWNFPTEDDAYEVLRLELSENEVLNRFGTCNMDSMRSALKIHEGRKLFHGTIDDIIKCRSGICLAFDSEVAKQYARYTFDETGDENDRPIVYEVEVDEDIQIADGYDLEEIYYELFPEDPPQPQFHFADNMEVQTALKKRGYDAIEYGDLVANSEEEHQTLRILNPDVVRIVRKIAIDRLSEGQQKAIHPDEGHILEYIREVLEDSRSFYGSNFLHTVHQYMNDTDEDGLAQYGIHYSNYPKWGINPRGGYFPKGVYFYFLTPQCRYGIEGSVFATDRLYANIGRINNSRMVILFEDHPRDFSERDLEQAKARIEQKYGPQDWLDPAKTKGLGPGGKSKFYRISYSPFGVLGQTLSDMEKKGVAGFNRLLHDAGYDGIVDYDGMLLPVESCQGVQTWPGGVELIQSIPNPRGGPPPDQRRENMMKGLEHRRNGSLRFSADDARSVIRMLPKRYSHWDMSDNISDLSGLLMRKIDFSAEDAWSGWAKEIAHHFYMDLEHNPTTPDEFWKSLLQSTDPGARLAAKDHAGVEWTDNERKVYG